MARYLNLIMGYGGMELRPCRLSASAAGVSSHPGEGGHQLASCNGRWQFLASACSRSASARCRLRTRGVYFIMITLAFAQMIYFVAIGLDRYGGDDGLTIYRRSEFAGLINLSNKTVFYYLCLGMLIATIYLTWRLVNSRFGMVIQGSRSNDRRMRAIGFAVFRHKARVLRRRRRDLRACWRALANHTDFITRR
jgi:branched-chain amino acid transport system permease protein